MNKTLTVQIKSYHPKALRLVCSTRVRTERSVLPRPGPWHKQADAGATEDLNIFHNLPKAQVRINVTVRVEACGKKTNTDFNELKCEIKHGESGV
ncbi:hypothetical protein F2Q68_00039365 [Brassica cretica]|uniref:Uncharacterized protein n=2 Tax=Brassica cretica TaxID=69181 RepID=A0A8S9MFK9_BRACR|nr:hypothetical protein F2Q68_00039365 [Brassica cretica]KAF3496417.1 hypothetical protein DY000_02052949 [Brassica cretica]